MKKNLMIAAALMAILSLASCKKEQPACWEVTIATNVKVMGEEPTTEYTSFTNYGTESEIDAMVKKMTSTSMSIPGMMEVTFDVDKKKLDKSEADCF